ncbi:syncollin-like [Protopterus annectens]|uniref:syncollin-like n=1 Tax=Protopterus annectens TaxID=7888 RepID=UPI001CFBC3D0|nr:syncollin-like [Protopterus annectens]
MAQCPAPSDLKDADGVKLCARMFEHSHYYNDQSCGGAQLDVRKEDDMPYMPKGWNNRASSLVVSSRCELRVWSRSPKVGNNRKFTSGTYYQLKDYRLGLFGNWNDAISSYFCSCT